MSKRLIAVDKLLADLYVEEAEGTVSMGMPAIFEIVLKQPTIDTERHGHFIQNEFISTLGMCSVCEHPIEDGDAFCKWCGAKMDNLNI